MAKRGNALSKRSLVVDEPALRRWVRIGGFRNESQAVRAAVERMLATQQMEAAIERLQRRGTFGSTLK
jgi:Arc/MetJ-type ribon-helix-helix transcriptional regulator